MRGRRISEFEQHYRPIVMLINLLPQSYMWTPEQRERWLHAITCNVDLLVDFMSTPTSGSAMTSPYREPTRAVLPAAVTR